VIDTQIPAAVRLQPDLVSFAAGGNDALRRSFDGTRLAERLDHVLKLLRNNGSDVLIFKFADVTGRLPGRRLILPRVTLLNSVAADLGAKHGAKLVDLWSDDEFRNPAMWSIDRLHMNGYGHRRVAAHAATALGLVPDAAWWDLPAPVPVPRWATRWAADARWACAHLAPWVRRRLTGQSSGDHRVAKRPDLTRLTE
jgi:hypothetical protein